jgi:hypothetical protein
MAQMDLQSDEFMTLLTDALRAGPGSPEWHQAVGVLRASGGGAGADDFQMLVRAREDLESGTEFRAVRAGPGFSRKVLTEIEHEGPGTKKGLPTANVIAWLAGLVLIAVVVGVAVMMLKTPPVDNKAVEQLRQVFFNTQVAQVGFEGSAASEPSPEWKMVGEVPLKLAKPNGLAPAATQPSNKDDKREYKSGALVLVEPIPADQARLVDVTFKVTRATDAIVPEVFVGPAADDAAGGGELVWQFESGSARVVLGSGAVPVEEKVDLKKSQTVNVKVRFDKDTVIVETGDKRLYEGPHKLSATAPRYVGVRFRRKVRDGGDGVWLGAVSVLKP